jgi:hypothetical protein
MTRSELLAFMRAHAMVVQASVSATGGPQAAVVGAVVTDAFEIFFDTLSSSRKVQNLRRNAKIAFVLGGCAGGEKTMQYEGVVDEPRGAELDALTVLYLKQFPDGRQRQEWPGLVYVRARPVWLRYSDFGQAPPLVIELTAAQLASLV